MRQLFPELLETPTRHTETTLTKEKLPIEKAKQNSKLKINK